MSEYLERHPVVTGVLMFVVGYVFIIGWLSWA